MTIKKLFEEVRKERELDEKLKLHKNPHLSIKLFDEGLVHQLSKWELAILFKETMYLLRDKDEYNEELEEELMKQVEEYNEELFEE